MLKSPVYLVPFDFTPMTNNALRIALKFSEVNDGSVFLLHVVKRQSDKKEARRQMELFANSLTPHDRKRVVVKVLAGNLYEEVGRAGDILDAPMSVMGTHGSSGLQLILGSNALKMVSKSPTPFLILVKDQPIEKVETIVMPFSFVKETLHVLESVTELAKQFDSIIHLVGYHDKKTWLKEQSIENQKLAKQFLADRGIPSEVVNLPKKKSYEEELSDYMYRVHADLIATTYFKNGILPPPNTFVQVMIDNDHEIPVLTVNGDEVTLRIEEPELA